MQGNDTQLERAIQYIQTGNEVSYQLLRLTELPNIFYNQQQGGTIVSPAKFNGFININKLNNQNEKTSLLFTQLRVYC